MTTRKTRIHGKILDSKKFEKLPFHKGQVNFPASMTIGEPEEAIENEKRRNINNAAKWGKEDVNKAIKQIENDPNIVEYKRQKTFGELSSFFGNPKKNPRVKEALDKWHERKDFNYIKKEQEVNNKKGGKRKTRRKTRRKRRKQRGGNTPECQTTQFTYEQLENREGETFHVKAPETDFMNDGNYILQDYGIDGQGGRGAGIGLVGVSGGANGDFHVDATDISRNRVRICKLDDGSEEKRGDRQAGGRRKKRRKTRKNKRSKKRRVKKRKTRKRRKKRR